MSRVRGHGIALEVPAGWEVRIAAPAAVVAGAAADPDGPEPERRALVHAGNFPLPEERGAFGSGAVERMGRGDVFIGLIEYDRASAGTALFAARGVPHALRPSDFDPKTMQRPIAGQSGVQRFFTEGGRAFCLYAVLGSHRARPALVPVLNQVLTTIEISA